MNTTQECIRKLTYLTNRFDYLTELKDLTGSPLAIQLNFTFSNLAKKRAGMYSEIHSKLLDKKFFLDNVTHQEAENTKHLFNQKKDWEERRKQLEFRRSLTALDMASFVEDSSSPDRDIAEASSPTSATKNIQDLPMKSFGRKKEGFLLGIVPPVNQSVTSKSAFRDVQWKKVWVNISNDELHGKNEIDLFITEPS